MKKYIKSSSNSSMTLDSLQKYVASICSEHGLRKDVITVQDSYSASSGFLITIENGTNMGQMYAEDLADALSEVANYVRMANESHYGSAL